MSSKRALAFAAVLAVAAAPTLSTAQNGPQPRRGGAAGGSPAPATPPTPAGGTPAPAGGGTAGGAATASGPVYTCVKGAKGVTVSFGKSELELQDLLDWAMTFKCVNFIYPAGIGSRTSKVVVMSPKKLSPDEAWAVFLAALNTMGLAVVPKDNALKIVESSTIKKESLQVRKGGVGNDDQMVRAIIRPNHVTADDLAAALNAMSSKDGLVTTLPKANLVLVTDYASHIAPMRTLVRDLDRAQTGDGLYVIKLQYADVTEVAQIVNDLLGVKAAGAAPPATGAAPRRGRAAGDDTTASAPAVTASAADVAVALPTKVIAEERTNSLIVLASEAAYLRVRALVKALDVPIAVEGGGRIHVYYLDNADAEELATTMTSVISGITQPSGAAGAGARGRAAQPPAAAGGGATGSSSEGPAFEGQVRVTHDKPTNSLVVVASVKDFLAVREVIRKLDIPRRQVFIEAVILEVSANMARDLGFSWHGGTTLDDGAIAIAGLQHTQLQSLNVASLATQTGLLGGIIGPLLEGAEELLGTSIPSFGILFQALATNSNVNVLSSPHILTTDNEAAEISVGQNIPYQASVSNFGQGTGGQQPGFGFPLQSIQRQDVALTLKITPHINASDMVRLEIDQEISDIADPDFNGNGPSWSKRTIKTTVVAKDQQSIVLGGLMADRSTQNESKIPLLGDIPILGYLFKYEQRTKTKTNLLILLTPYVIKDQMDIEEIVQRKVRERQEFVRAFANFRRMGYRSGIDYRRKRGLLAEINHVVQAIEEEEALLKELDRKDEAFPDGRIEYDTTDEEEGEEGAGAAPAPAPPPPPPPAADVKPADKKPADKKPAEKTP